MKELSRHIGANTDVPAGDIGVGGREVSGIAQSAHKYQSDNSPFSIQVAFMFGAYKQIRNEWTGILTGKGFDFGGSRIRPEATGYGLVYYVTHMLKEARNEDWTGKRVAISGAGNVAQVSGHCLPIRRSLVPQARSAPRFSVRAAVGQNSEPRARIQGDGRRLVSKNI